MTEKQMANARRMWANGWTVREIAYTLGVRVSDLKPWIERQP